MKINDLIQIKCFNLIYQYRNITKAAQKMNISKVAMTKRLAILEEELGYKLFKRSTRLITPTIEADNLYLETSRLIEHVLEIENLFAKENELSGQVRITCSTSMAKDHLAELILEFQQDNPLIIVELVVTDSQLDLIESNIDLAIRINPSKSINLIGRKIVDYKFIFVTTQKYLKNRKIKNITDLKDHRLFYLDHYKNYLINEDRIKIGQIICNSNFKTNDPETLTQLVLGGHGIAIRPDWSIKKLLNNGNLIQIFKNKSINNQGEIWILNSAGKLQSKRVKILNDYLYEKLKLRFGGLDK